MSPASAVGSDSRAQAPRVGGLGASFRSEWGESSGRRRQAQEQGPAACGVGETGACERTAFLRWCAAKQRGSGGIAVFAEVSRAWHCVCACFSFLSAGKRLPPFLSLAADFCGKQAPAWMCGCSRVYRQCGRKGWGEMTHPCPAGQGYAAGVRIRRCLPLRGKSASELARLILGVSRGRAGRWGALPIRNGWQARRENGSMPSCAP